MNATARAKARQRKAEFLADKGQLFPVSKKTAKAGKLLWKYNRQKQFQRGDYFHDERNPIGFCDANMKVHTPFHTAKGTGKLMGWVAKGMGRKMNKLVPDNLQVSVN